MAFLVAGTLQAAAQVADTRESLGRKPSPALALPLQGRYGLQGPRAALLLSSPGVPARIPQLLEDAFRALGFHSCQRREAEAQAFLGELAGFREQLDAQGGPVGCALVAVVAPAGQLRQPLARELSRSTALRGCPKVLLLLSSAPGAPLQPGAFPSSLAELCGRAPQQPLLRLLTEVFLRVTEASPGATGCPVLRSSLRGSLCLQEVEPWKPEPEGVGTRYELAGARAALIVAVVRGRPGALRDVEALRGLCQALGFQTTVRTDATAQAFQEELARFREQLDSGRGTVSCALVALMAHGGPGGQLQGADGQAVQHEALVRELSRCRALRGRPKIFLLQACRGGHRDAGVGRPALSWFWRWLQAPPVTPSHADILQVYASAQGMSSGDPAPGSCEQADILTAYAAAQGHVAYRDESGSDFIQTLVEVIRAEPQGELLELLTEVNRRVCELDVLGPDSDEPRKACLEIRSSLRRALHLRP
ncbi:caspase-8-like [Sorex araneus]|uniref:caspase-8-like n=1 Tax=Sorex araneus TaxID=42254 RepID=UPI000331567E|nr:caspase-8-like [Sorex araneus]